jgi:hypothetical protein
MTNSDSMDRTKAAHPMPVPAFASVPSPDFDLSRNAGRAIGTGAAISAAVSSL